MSKWIEVVLESNLDYIVEIEDNEDETVAQNIALDCADNSYTVRESLERPSSFSVLAYEEVIHLPVKECS